MELKTLWLKWYEDMLLWRKFEEKAAQLYGQQKIRGFCHLSIGQEAVIAGTIEAISPEDAVITAYRDHSHAIAKGLDPRHIMAELYGKVTGCSKGRGGSMHMFSREHKFFGGHGIVGAQIPLGAGIAFAEKYNDRSNVCLTYFGDGAVNQGAFGETLNMAALWKLPVVFICENNHYAMGTALKRSSATQHILDLAKPFGIPAQRVDGMKCDEVFAATSEAVKRARKGQGPSFLELETYRYKGHSMSDPARYRSRQEVEKYKALDPITYAKSKIEKLKLVPTASWFDEIGEKVKAIVEDAVRFAEASEYPAPGDLYEDIYVQQDYPFVKK